MLTETTFYYLRHGETDWNKERRMQGATDVRLNAAGITQAHRAKEALRGCPIETICCSPLSRAHDTALIVNEVLRAPIVVIDDLRECSFGSLEGEVRGNWYDAWRSGMEMPEGVDVYAEFIERALVAVNESLSNEGPVLIVGHGGVYWTIQEHGASDIEGNIPNAVPIRHDPPNGLGSVWTTTLIE